MEFLAVIVVTGVLLVWLQTRHVRRVAVERRSSLASVQHVLERPQLTQRGIDYPVLTGDYRGAPVTVAIIVDTLTLRTLPTLWLSVTRRQPLPLPGPVDLLLRPSTTDIVSPGERFPAEHPVPPTWPAYIRVATPPGGSPDLVELSAALPLLHNPRTKDVLAHPGGRASRHRARPCGARPLSTVQTRQVQPAAQRRRAHSRPRRRLRHDRRHSTLRCRGAAWCSHRRRAGGGTSRRHGIRRRPPATRPGRCGPPVS